MPPFQDETDALEEEEGPVDEEEEEEEEGEDLFGDNIERHVLAHGRLFHYRCSSVKDWLKQTIW